MTYFYQNPHARMVPQPQQFPQQFQQPQYQQQFQQQPQQQQPPRLAMVNTEQGPRLLDTVTGQFIPFQGMPQPNQMQQMPNQMPQPQRLMTQQARLMMGSDGTQYTEQGTDDNRFGASNRPLLQPQPQENIQMRVPNQTNVPAVLENKNFVPGDKLLKNKNTSFLPRTRPFVEKEVQQITVNVVGGGGFGLLMSELYDQAYENDAEGKILTVAESTLSEVFHQTSLLGMIEELFQTDIEGVYRFMNKAVDNLSTRPDIVFMSEYNRWLTDRVNDCLKIHVKSLNIDSFVEDFNDLKKYLEGKVSIDGETNIYDALTRNMRIRMNLALDTHRKVKLDVPDTDSVYLVESGNIVYVKLLSTELFTDGVPDNNPEDNRLMSSIGSFTSSEVFYLMTMDKVVYKVFSRADKTIIVEMVGN